MFSDQGRNFESEVVKELRKLYGIQKSRGTPYPDEIHSAKDLTGHCTTGCERSTQAKRENGQLFMFIMLLLTLIQVFSLVTFF